MNDKAIWSSSNVVKGKTGNEREFGPRPDVQDVDFIRRGDLRRVDAVEIGAAFIGQTDTHPGRDLSQRPKKSVAVTGDADGAQPSRHGRSTNMANALAKTGGIVIGKNGHRQMKRRDLESP